jgi:hypothetical protein
MRLFFVFSLTLLMFHTATQYCDGLRGAFVVYDPNDPHKDHYTVDNGPPLSFSRLQIAHISI